MPYPRKVQFNSGQPHFDDVDSERDYITHEIDSTITTNYEYGTPNVDRAVRPFYEDEETGILTRDVAKFEAWMRTVVTK